jgi:hypothetical protein
MSAMADLDAQRVSEAEMNKRPISGAARRL